MTKRLSFISTIAFTIVAMVTVALYSVAPSADAATVSLSSLEAGDLIRGESYSAVYYYGADGFRYVFPNSKTYFTWYDNFDGVKWLADSDLSKVQIGGNVTYKPGSQMIKINSDPKTYAVSAGGTLRHITSEAIAIELYGSSWNKQVDDVPDGFFPNYSIGSALEFASSFSVSGEKATASSINSDKGLKSAAIVSISESGYSPATTTINAGTAVKFTNNGSDKHSASADNKKWGTGTLNIGDSFSKYFNDAGTYTYHDAYNSGLTATIIVQ